MIKKVNTIFIMLFVLLFTANVNAAYTTLEKAENSGELYNIMPTEVKKGDIISIKVIAREINGKRINYGYNNIHWDKDAFDIVETNGKYYTKLSDKIDYVYSYFLKDNALSINWDWKFGLVSHDEEEELFEIKFRVKSNAKNDIYEIYQDYTNDAIVYYINPGEEYSHHGYANDTTLRYQIGKPKLISDYTKDKIGNNTYIIGSYMFTREGSDEYNGILTTDYIMLSSSSIINQTKENMIVYAKNAKGNWINAITNEEITPPDEFEVTYIDMKTNYQENGIYSDDSNKTIVELVQINGKEAVIIIETDKERIKGIGAVNGREVSLNVDGVNYKITISDNEVNIVTSDNYVGNKRLQKKANYSVRDYFNFVMHPAMGDETVGLSFFNSAYTGKYVYGNYELYVVRVSDDFAKICLKEKGSSYCLIKEEVSGNEGGWALDGEETTYLLSLDEVDYGLDWNESQFELKCFGNCSNSLTGIYTKESSLSMEDVIRIWDEENDIEYKITFDENNGNDPWSYYTVRGSLIDMWDPYKDGYTFVEWQVDGQRYNFDTPITKPITLVAVWEETYACYANDFNISNATQVGWLTSATSSLPYKINGITTMSDCVIAYTITFDSNGGSAVESQTLEYNGKVTEPANPTKEGYTFVEWQLNGYKYDFSTPVTGNITLVATWSMVLPTPIIHVTKGEFYDVFDIVIDNYNNQYSYKLYKKENNNYKFVNSFSEGMSSYNIYGSYNEVEIYVIKAVLENSLNNGQSEFSNEAVIDLTMEIDSSISSPILEVEENTKLIYVDSNNAFYAPYVITNFDDTVDGYMIFYKIGDNILKHGEKSDPLPIVHIIGENKSYIYVVYAFKNSGDKRIYSQKSNEIMFDLTNPAYTFETIDVENDSTKVIVRAYINDYEIFFNQVNVDGDETNYTDEGESNEFTMSKSAIENADTISLKLSENKVVTATRKN